MVTTTVDGEKAAAAAAVARHGFKFGENQVSDALLDRLSELGLSAPRLVATKRLQSTDARANQNRLQLSGRSPISQAFTDAEKAILRTHAGMSVTAFDRRGGEYEMTCKLWKDKYYRFMGEGWKRFREAHLLTIPNEAILTRRVTVELWAFRLRALPPPPPAEEDCSGQPHPEGVLGLVMLLRDDGGEQGEAADEEAAPPAESILLLMAAIGLLSLRTMAMDTTSS